MGEFLTVIPMFIEKYQCNRLNVDINESYMSMHYTNDPIYPLYNIFNVNEKYKMRMIDALKKSRKRK